MADVGCSRCGGIAEIETDDLYQADMEDIADDTLVFRFTGYCENILHDYSPGYGKDDEIGDECGQTIEIIRYAKLHDYIDIEQKEH